MIYLDVTKSAAAGHRSGLTRVTSQLADHLPAEPWSAGKGGWQGTERDWLVTAEIFTVAERPVVAAMLRQQSARLAAIFHDAIPLKFPAITWPQAVARHPAYMSMLAEFDRVWAVSEASRADLLGFWRWQGRLARAEVGVIALGADGVPQGPRPPSSVQAQRLPMLLCVGIVEPRKRQDFLVELCQGLWNEGLKFDVVCVGRVNPVFGKPIQAKLRAARNPSGRPVYAGPVGDDTLASLYSEAAACVFPTQAEGCGLPLLESLWHGTPCIASDLPSLRENARAGCLLVPCDDRAAWAAALRGLLTSPPGRQSLAGAAAAARQTLPGWKDTAATVRAALV